MSIVKEYFCKLPPILIKQCDRIQQTTEKSKTGGTTLKGEMRCYSECVLERQNDAWEVFDIS